MRVWFFVMALSILLLPHAADAPRIRVLLRDTADVGVADATLNLRTERGQAFHLTTDANGVAVTAALDGALVWFIGGTLRDGTALHADSYPADVGFRLVLIPGQVRDALLRLDGAMIVLDPDMIFSPDDPSAPRPVAPQLVATVPPLSPAAPPLAGVPSPNMSIGTTTEAPAVDSATSSSALWIVLALVGVGVVLIAGAVLIGRARRRQA